MQDCKPCDTPMAKGDKFSLSQCLKNDFKKKENAEDSLCISSRESDVCSGMYASRYCVHCWDAMQIFEQSRDRPLKK